jgi:hypothetical protein
MHLPPQSPAVAPQPSIEAQPERIEILEAFADLPDVRQASGKRHHMALCLALFTLAVNGRESRIFVHWRLAQVLPARFD